MVIIVVCRWYVYMDVGCFFFFFQAEDGIRDAQESRGLGDVYKRQIKRRLASFMIYMLRGFFVLFALK